MDELRADCDQSLIDQYLEQELCKAQAILPSWDGRAVHFFQFDCEIFAVTFRIEHASRTGNLTIICTTQIVISGPFEWPSSALRLNKDAESLLLSDEKASFLLRAHVIDVIENAEPINVIFKR